MALAIGTSLYEAAGINAWDDKEMTMAMLAGISKANSRMNGIGQKFGQENRFLPPVMTSQGIKDYAQLQEGQIKKDLQEQKKLGVTGQDFRQSWWKQWKWVID